ncbi:hypothetical protein FSP39_002731 [Pinctada imbricata]|uniref:peptidylprolyl isomerase n=1 Tax=Pinctada imbricata TaxID=66713 RepID=A0AA88XKH8_PINIB|nr:hypothetical protein FSP39_002731 [Pinctada imbricata]
MDLRDILKILVSLCVICSVLAQTEKKKEDVKIEVLAAGDCSRKSTSGSLMRCHYVGKLTNGKVFEDSYEKGKPVLFLLGAGQVLKGWERGLQDMCVGEKRRLTIPPHLGYGSKENGEIPPKSTLIYEIEVLDIKSEEDLDEVFPRLDINSDGVLDMTEVSTFILYFTKFAPHIT